MDCETNDCRKEKRGCKGCYYNESEENMSDKNIDKDIEMLKEAVDVLTGNATSIKLDFEGTAQAIENVLSELEKQKNFVEHLGWNGERLQDLLNKSDKELETYKKMVEKLADIVALNTVPKEECNQCIIDWARKEVEKQ